MVFMVYASGHGLSITPNQNWPIRPLLRCIYKDHYFTKRCENATADKTNVNPLLIPWPVGRRSESPPPRKHKLVKLWGGYTRFSPVAWEGRGGGVKWLMHLILDPISKSRRPAATKNLMIAAYRISAIILFLTQRDPIRAICQCQSNCHILHTAGNMNPLHSHSSLASLSLHNYRPSLRHAQELSFSLQWTL